MTDAALDSMLHDTVLEGKELHRLYSAVEHGFDNVAFFERSNLGLGGIPCLVIGLTLTGRVFAGFNPVGFEARDDYRDTRAACLFVVKSDGSVMRSETLSEGKSAVFDFYDEAIKFGSSALVIPMNPAKSCRAANWASSSLGIHYTRLESEETSLFGEASCAELEDLEVWTDRRFVDEAADIQARKRRRSGRPLGGFLGRIF